MLRCHRAHPWGTFEVALGCGQALTARSSSRARGTCSEPHSPATALPSRSPARLRAAPGNICKEIAEGIERGGRKRSAFFF